MAATLWRMHTERRTFRVFAGPMTATRLRTAQHPQQGARIMTTIAPDEFAGKVAYITGSARGIPRTTPQAFASAGARVALVDIDDENNTATARLIREAGGEALQLHTDNTKEDEVRSRQLLCRDAVNTAAESPTSDNGIQGDAVPAIFTAQWAGVRH